MPEEAEKVARKGCRLIVGLEGARIRTEVDRLACRRADVLRLADSQ